KKDLKIVFRTAPMVRSVVSLRRALNPAIKKRVKDVLVNMHRDPEGRKVLRRYFKVRKYDEINGEAASQLAEARDIYTHLPTGLK
ncbi:MAG: PhnD/SsuA/transferrin family substrate-binding protein, partial [Nitrospinota bacterium]